MEVREKNQTDSIQSSVRALKCEQSVLSRADGSAIFSQGNTVVMASVFGPLEPKIQKELPDRMYVEVNYKPKTGMPGVAERGKESLIQTACNAILLTNVHPRTAATITIQEMQDAGCVLAAALNATCLALLDSGLPLQCLLAAITCVVNEKGEIILDPPVQKLQEGYEAILTFGFSNRKSELIVSHCEGRVSQDTFKKCLKLCQTASHVIFDFYRNAVMRKFSKEL